MQLLRRFLVPIIVFFVLLVGGVFGLRACLSTTNSDGSTAGGGNSGILSRIFPNAAGPATLTPAPAQPAPAAQPPAATAVPVVAPQQPAEAPTAAPPAPAAAPAAPVLQEVTPVPPVNANGDIISGNSGSGAGPSGGSTGNEAGGVQCGTRIIHTVRAGENLFRIGLRYNTTASAIARLNRITNVRNVSVGRRLVVVACARGGGSSGAYYAARSGTYMVRAGDTLFGIASRFGINVQYLCRVNGLYTSLIVPGQTLVIP